MGEKELVTEGEGSLENKQAQNVEDGFFSCIILFSAAES